MTRPERYRRSRLWPKIKRKKILQEHRCCSYIAYNLVQIVYVLTNNST